MTIVSELLKANLGRVFNERDPVRRSKAIHELYAADAVLHDDQGKFSGTEAIVGAVSQLVGGLPPSLTFALVAVAENHDMGKLLWRGQLSDGTVVVTGTDVAQVQGGRIQALYVFVDGLA